MTSIDPEVLSKLARESLILDGCSLSYFSFADNFGQLELLRTTIEDLITREEKADIERLAAFSEQLPEGQRSEYWAENHPYEWEHIIAPQFRASFLATVMAAVELHLGRLTRDAGRIARAPIDVDDLKGALYPRTRRFLSRLCGIQGPS